MINQVELTELCPQVTKFTFRQLTLRFLNAFLSVLFDQLKYYCHLDKIVTLHRARDLENKFLIIKQNFSILHILKNYGFFFIF